MTMTGEQMDFLANEFAEQTLERIRHTLPKLTERQTEILRLSIGMAYLEGLGRGQRSMKGIAERTFVQLLERLSAIGEKAGT